MSVSEPSHNDLPGLKSLAWTPPDIGINNTGTPAFAPRIAVEADPGFNGGSDDISPSAFAVWIEYVDTNPADLFPPVYHVFSSRWDGFSWSVPVDVGTGSLEHHALSPEIDADSRGNAFVSWHEFSPAEKHQRIFSRRYTMGSGWEPEFAIDQPFGGTSSSKDITIEPDGDGTAMAVWAQNLAVSQDPPDFLNISPGIGAGLNTGTTATDRAQSPYILRLADNTYRLYFTRFDGTFQELRYKDTTDTNPPDFSNIPAGTGTSLNTGTSGTDQADQIHILRLADSRYRVYFARNTGTYWELRYKDTTDTNPPDSVNIPSGIGTFLNTGTSTTDRAHGPFVFRLAGGQYRLYFAYHNGTFWELRYKDTTDTNPPDSSNIPAGIGTTLNTGTAVGDRALSPQVILLPDGKYRLYFSLFNGTYWGLQYKDTSDANPPDSINIPAGGGLTLNTGSSASDYALYSFIIPLPSGLFRLYYSHRNGTTWILRFKDTDHAADQILARRYTGGAWALSDAVTGCTPGGVNGPDDGICDIDGGMNLMSTSPVVEMDNTGRATAAFIRFDPISCDTGGGTAGRPGSINNLVIVCQAEKVYARRFDLTSWSPPVDLTPAPVLVDPSAILNENCQDTGSSGGNSRGRENPNGNTSCLDITDLQIIMDSTPFPGGGNAVVAFRTYEHAVLSNQDILTGFQPTADAIDVHERKAVYVSRYDGSTGLWGSRVVLTDYEYSPSIENTLISDCPSFTASDTEDYVGLMNCAYYGLALAGEPDDGTRAMVAYQRYDGTFYDLVVHRYDGTVFGTVTDGDNCTNLVSTCWHNIDAGGGDVSRPDIAMDNNGNAIVVWAQQDFGGDWRVFSNRCVENFGTCLWSGPSVIDGGLGGEHYFEPVVGMEALNGGNFSALDCGGSGGATCGNAVSLYNAMDSVFNFRIDGTRWSPP